MLTRRVFLKSAACAMLPLPVNRFADGQNPASAKVIIDTDIGDDIDDAFALALALNSLELRILGVTTAWGETDRRARLASRFLHENGRDDIPVAIGMKTAAHIGPQFRWAADYDGPPHPRQDAVDFILKTIADNPGQITLICIGPLTNIGAAIDRDATVFRKLKQVALMGGSIAFSYTDLGYGPPSGPVPEYNIYTDLAAARKLFSSGVPIVMMGLDATTELKLDEVKRRIIFTHATALTNALALLYLLWGQETPTLYDPMAIAITIDPTLCDLRPLHIEIDDHGVTRTVSNQTSNARAGVNPKVDRFFQLLMPRLLH